MTIEQLKAQRLRAELRMEAAIKEFNENTEGVEIGSISYVKGESGFEVKINVLVERSYKAFNLNNKK